MICPGGFRVRPRPPGYQGAAGRRRELSERTDPAAALPGWGSRCHVDGQLSPSPPWLPSRRDRDRDRHPAPAGTVRAFPLTGSLKPFFLSLAEEEPGRPREVAAQAESHPPAFPGLQPGHSAVHLDILPRGSVPASRRRSADGSFPLRPSLRNSPPWVPSAARRPDRQAKFVGRCPLTPESEALTWAPAPPPAGSPDPRSSSAPPARQSPGSRGA